MEGFADAGGVPASAAGAKANSARAMKSLAGAHVMIELPFRPDPTPGSKQWKRASIDGQGRLKAAGANRS